MNRNKMNFVNKALIIVIIMTTLYMFYNQVYEHYNHQDPHLNGIVEEICAVFPKAKKLRFYVGNESYTINKEKVYICTRDKKTNKLYNDNVIKYVILHEYTHSICPEIGHTPLYHKMFNDVLDKAVKEGLYDPNTQIPMDYCK